jgi:hypothetical protein
VTDWTIDDPAGFVENSEVSHAVQWLGNETTPEKQARYKGRFKQYNSFAVLIQVTAF